MNNTLTISECINAYRKELHNSASKYNYVSFMIRELETYKKDTPLLSWLDKNIEKCDTAAERSMCKRFREFIVRHDIGALRPDPGPQTNALLGAIDIYLELRHGKLRSEKSVLTYRNILLAYAAFIHYDPARFNKITAREFIHKTIAEKDGIEDTPKAQRSLKLYRSVISAFAKWALWYIETSTKKLSRQKLAVVELLNEIGYVRLQEVRTIYVESADPFQIGRTPLTEDERDQLMDRCRNLQEKAIVSLMAYNGLRITEVEALMVKDCDIEGRKIYLPVGKGQMSSDKSGVHFLKVPRRHVAKLIEQMDLPKGSSRRLFRDVSTRDIVQMVCDHLEAMGLRNSNKHKKYTAESLRNTAGQLLYNSGAKFEEVHQTMRNKDYKATAKYAENFLKETYYQSMWHR